MSSIVFQGIQSCLEPRTVEPLVLRLRLTPPKSDSDDSENNNNKNGWNFIQALTNTPFTPKDSRENDEKVYVHPMASRSASKLNEKSLEMCTESLGSETGCDISQTMDDNYYSDSSPRSRRSKILGTSSVAPKKRCLPPPLTSISGGSGGCVQVKTHREGGRVVMRAVTVSSSPTFFHAERGNGRLRLHLFKTDSDDDDDDEDETEEDEESDDSVGWGEDMNVGGNMGINKFENPTRCKDELWNLEAYWITTSS